VPNRACVFSGNFPPGYRCPARPFGNTEAASGLLYEIHRISERALRVAGFARGLVQSS
jgi:hypothetical protein